jgi:hypothetical protein
MYTQFLGNNKKTLTNSQMFYSQQAWNMRNKICNNFDKFSLKFLL